MAQKLWANDTASRLLRDSNLALQDWKHLLELTTLPAKIASSDPAVATKIGHLDSMIVGNHGKFISRLAHIQFVQVMETLEAIIAKERSSGLIEPQRERESAKNAAYRKYREASARPVGAQQLYNLKRYCKRYQTLARPSPLFILAYTDEVDIVVKSFSYDNPTIELVARFINENAPAELVQLCHNLAKNAENCIQLSQSC
ncbi:hypothetical protein F5Y03DRAFT_403550 [Xylaria venustula]|nr:hypothetical protein F5Y03DRAFT_403550 [Xylaria venustula]